MKRRPSVSVLFMAMLLLLAWGAAGAIVNVAVAWIGANVLGDRWAMAGSSTSYLASAEQGWPAASFTMLSADGVYRREIILGRFELATHPLWPGFAINTGFYAFVLWLMYAVPRALRGRRRIKRGLCVKCGYDLRGRTDGATICPECGAHAASKGMTT